MGPEHPLSGIGMNNLALLYRTMGRLAEAETLYKRALEILEKGAGDNSTFTAICLYSLAEIYQQQQRDAEAGPLFQRALEIRLKVLGRENPMTIDSLQTAAGAAADAGRAAEAEQGYVEALTLRRKVQGANHPATARALNLLALFYAKEHRYAEAEKLLRQSLAEQRRLLGREHPDVGTALLNLAWLYANQARFAEALPLADEAVTIGDQPGLSPWTRHKCHYLRAQILWYLGRHSQAVADLQIALDQAEQQRGLAGGAEHERSQVFGNFADAYEAMVAWQSELGNAAAAWEAVERSRARSLLDEMALAGADLDADRPAAERRAPASARRS